MTRKRSLRWMAPSMLAVACAALVLGVVPAQGEMSVLPGDIHARVTAHEVTMDGWPADAGLSIQIDGAHYSRTAAPNGHADIQSVDLSSGTMISVQVTDGPSAGLANEMIVGPLEITEVDYANDLVHGLALPSVGDPQWGGTLVQVCTAFWATGTTEGGCRWVSTDQTTDAASYGTGSSTWTADFSEAVTYPGGNTEPGVDLLPYWSGVEASQQAVPVGLVENRTMTSPTQFPYLDVQYRADWDPPASGDAVALGFDEGTGVHFTLVRGGEEICTQMATVQPPVVDPDGMTYWLPFAPFDVWADGCNPQPDDMLVADGTYLDRPLTKELVIVTPRTTTGQVGVDADIDANVLTGTVPAGYDVYIEAWDGGSRVQVAVPTGATTFMADMDDAEPAYDVQPWSWFGVQVLDPDGDLVDTQLRTMPLVFSVDPSHDLVGGQTVLLSGENFTPGPATVMQGSGFIGGLDESTAMPVEIGPDGSVSIPYQVQQFINVPVGPEQDEYVTVDCAAVDEGNTCFIALVSDPDWAQAWTYFLPAEVNLSLDPTGRLNKASGRVTVSGSLSCTTMDSVLIEGTLSQRVGRKSLATGSFAVEVSCTQGSWSATVSPSGTIPFGTGAAELRATATLMAGDWSISDTPDPQIISIKAPKK